MPNSFSGIGNWEIKDQSARDGIDYLSGVVITAHQVFSGGPDIKVDNGTIGVDTNGTVAANKTYTFVAGEDTYVAGNGAAAFGGGCTARGGNSFACGYQTYADSSNAHAEGFKASAMASNSHAEGMQTFTNDGSAAHAEGNGSSALGEASHAEGEKSYAYGECSHAQGYYTSALSDNSFAAGNHTIAASADMTVIGHYNRTSANALFVIGNGTGDTRGDVLTVDNEALRMSKFPPNTSYNNIIAASAIALTKSTAGGGFAGITASDDTIVLETVSYRATIESNVIKIESKTSGPDVSFSNVGITAQNYQGSPVSIDWVTLINKVNAL